MVAWPRIVAILILGLVAAGCAEGQARLPAPGASSRRPDNIATQPPDPVRLAYRFQAGRASQQQVKLEGYLWRRETSGTAGAPETVPVTLKGGYSLTRQVRSASPDGSAVVDFTPAGVSLQVDALGGLVSAQVRDGQVTLSVNGRPVQLQNPPGVPDAAEPAAITAVIAADGRILQAKALAGTAPGSSEGAVLFAAELAVQTAPAFPSRAVSQGDSWTAVWQLSLRGERREGDRPGPTLAIESRSTLVSLLNAAGRRIAIIETTTRTRVGPLDGAPGEPAQRTGSFRTEFDVDRGEVIRSEGLIGLGAEPGNAPWRMPEGATAGPGPGTSGTLDVSVETVGAAPPSAARPSPR